MDGFFVRGGRDARIGCLAARWVRGDTTEGRKGFVSANDPPGYVSCGSLFGFSGLAIAFGAVAHRLGGETGGDHAVTAQCRVTT